MPCALLTQAFLLRGGSSVPPLLPQSPVRPLGGTRGDKAPAVLTGNAPGVGTL